MHPFGGTPICPRCEKAVYAAEQIMGPDRTLYHKFCLTCASCNRRLDSRSLVEHNKEPYCTHCHRKNFAPKDLRQANLPDRDEVPELLMPSPVKALAEKSQSQSPSKQSPISPSWTHRNQSSPPPIYKRVSDSVREIQDRSLVTSSPDRSVVEAASPSPRRRWTENSARSSSPVASSSRVSPPTRSFGEPKDNLGDISEDGGANESGDEKRVEQAETEPTDGDDRATTSLASPTRNKNPPSFAATRALNANFTGPPSPLRQTMTGTRYGAALTSQYTGNAASLNGPLSPTRNFNFARPGSPTKATMSPLSPTATGRGWSPRTASPIIGGGTPKCAHCEKAVYFAEQVKAVGKIFHKPCLRCTDCNASLDSNRLAEKDGRVVCRSCYSKNYGPLGSGYALVGKAGG